MQLPSALFRPNSKNKKNHSKKKILIFQEMELPDSKISNIFSKESFLIFPEIEPWNFQPMLEK